jgi:hypothetical protein
VSRRNALFALFALFALTNGVTMRAFLVLCALCLTAAFASAAPPLVVTATDDGRSYVLCPDGLFRLASQATPLANPAPCVCGDGCKCDAGTCPGKCPTTSAVNPLAPASPTAPTGDGLDEVNAKRAARGLRPFVRDEGLTRAAASCAAFRASHLLFGHTANDFAFVPPGAQADAAGCAAYPASYGWMSCCTYEGYTHAGAAWVTGADGKRYMHLFVSYGGGSSVLAGQLVPASQPVTQPQACPSCSSCQGGSCPAPTAPARRGLFR